MAKRKSVLTLKQLNSGKYKWRTIGAKNIQEAKAKAKKLGYMTSKVRKVRFQPKVGKTRYSTYKKLNR